MDHRGAINADNSSGDGAGILIQIPHEFIVDVLKVNVGEPGQYGTGLIFLPRDEKESSVCLSVLSQNIEAEGLEMLGYRDVPVDSTVPGEIAKINEPVIRQVFVKASLEKDVLERKLYLVRLSLIHI